MLKKIVMAGLAVGALAVNAPAALAGPPASVDCRFRAVTQATVTGQDTWEGAVAGYVVGDTGANVSIRCEVRVGTSVRGSTSTQSGTTVAAVAEHVQFTRSLTETPSLCAIWTNGSSSGEVCVPTTTQQIPPQEVIDALQPVFDALTNAEIQFVDPTVCPLLTGLNGSYGPIEIKEGSADPVTGAKGGDVYVNGELQWDCPGYEPV